jgi:protein-S-isoprenylcysteine O-methyltransferase Ste14
MRLNTIVNAIALAVLLMLAMGLALHGREIHWTAARIVGALVIAGSLALGMVARLQLGESFSVSAKARKLVTTGLYSRIRNPIYVLGELLFVGIAIAAWRWEVLLVPAVLAPVQMVRAKKEEAVLAAAFGEEYERYKARTWF